MDKSQCILLIFLFFCILERTESKNWGEICQFDEDCTDHRQLCDLTNINSIRRCSCNGFHEWNSDLVSCIPRYNSTFLLTIFREKYNTTGWIAHEAKLMYHSALIAGAFVTTFAFLAFVVVILYCLHIRHRDGALKKLVTEMKNSQKQPKPSTSNNQP